MAFSCSFDRSPCLESVPDYLSTGKSDGFLAGSIPYKHPCVVSFIPRGIIGLQESELNNLATKTRCPGGGIPEYSEQVTMQLNQLRMHVFFGKKIYELAVHVIII
jgi:hypothetical protein